MFCTFFGMRIVAFGMGKHLLSYTSNILPISNLHFQFFYKYLQISMFAKPIDYNIFMRLERVRSSVLSKCQRTTDKKHHIFCLLIFRSFLSPRNQRDFQSKCYLSTSFIDRPRYDVVNTHTHTRSIFWIIFILLADYM